jgi:hypothetical protein
MTEWKAAGWVFLVLACIGAGLLIYHNREQHLHFTYKNCQVDYTYRSELDSLSDEYMSAQRKLGKCLCELYLVEPDSTLKKLIVRQSQYGYPAPPDTTHSSPYKSLDSLIKYRKEVFDPIIYLD